MCALASQRFTLTIYARQFDSMHVHNWPIVLNACSKSISCVNVALYADASAVYAERNVDFSMRAQGQRQRLRLAHEPARSDSIVG